MTEGASSLILDQDFDTNLNTIQNNALFSLTWKGFRLRSNSSGKYLDISSDNDLRIITPGSNGEDVARLKIGQIAR